MAKIELPYPPSMNRLWRNFGGRMVLSTEGRKYKSVAALTAKLSGVRLIEGEVGITVILHPKKNKDGSECKSRQDLDNVLKAAIDSLNGVAYKDDKQITMIIAEVGDPIPHGGLTIEVRAREV